MLSGQSTVRLPHDNTNRYKPMPSVLYGKSGRFFLSLIVLLFCIFAFSGNVAADVYSSGTLVVNAAEVNSEALAEKGLSAVEISPEIFLINLDFEKYAWLFGSRHSGI